MAVRGREGRPLPLRAPAFNLVWDGVRVAMGLLVEDTRTAGAPARVVLVAGFAEGSVRQGADGGLTNWGAGINLVSEGW